MRPLRHALAALPIALALALFALVALVATAPATPSGLAYAAALLLFAGAALPVDPARRRRGRLAALALLSLTVAVRVVAPDGHSLRMATPESTSPRSIDRVVDEEDLAVNASRALAWTHFVRDPDVPDLARAMTDAYGRMRRAEGATPSPVLATYAGLQGPGDDDTLEIGDVASSEGAVVFLHGFAGSFTLPCWEVSRAATLARFATVCPSTRWIGDWWSGDGDRTLRETVLALRRRGARRIVLAGLSNGGIGASLLAARWPGTFAGLVLISGASPDAASAGVPTLVIQGERDAQISASVSRAYADRVHARYLSLDAGHFALLMREDRVVTELASFLESLPRAGTPAETARRGPPP